MAMEAAFSSTASARPGLPGVIVAATIGNVLEWFDFLVYGFFAVTIAEVFLISKASSTYKECFLSLGCFSRSSISSGSDRVCSLRRDQTSTCRNNPTVTPQNNRIDCSKSRNGVASGNLPDAIRSLQHSSSISNLPYYPSINCSRLCFRKRCRPWFRFVTDGR